MSRISRSGGSRVPFAETAEETILSERRFSAIILSEPLFARKLKEGRDKGVRKLEEKEGEKRGTSTGKFWQGNFFFAVHYFNVSVSCKRLSWEKFERESDADGQFPFSLPNSGITYQGHVVVVMCVFAAKDGRGGD